VTPPWPPPSLFLAPHTECPTQPLMFPRSWTSFFSTFRFWACRANSPRVGLSKRTQNFSPPPGHRGFGNQFTNVLHSNGPRGAPSPPPILFFLIGLPPPLPSGHPYRQVAPQRRRTYQSLGHPTPHPSRDEFQAPSFFSFGDNEDMLVSFLRDTP